MNSLMHRLTTLPRWAKRFIVGATDLVLMPVMLWAAFALRYGEVFPAVLERHWQLLLLVPLLSLPVFWMAGMYRSVIRFMGIPAVVAVLKGATISAVLFMAIVTLGRLDAVPRTSYFIYWLLLVGGLAGIRFAARSLLPVSGRPQSRKTPVMVYGAGLAGIQLAGMLQNGNEYWVRAFVDDDPTMQGTEIHGIPVHAPGQIGSLIDKYQLEQILLAMPSAKPARRREIITRLEPLPVHVRTVPGLGDIVSGEVSLDQLREIDPDDLLSRPAVVPDPDMMVRSIRGGVIMVTGAGGSIGSELARQIVRCEPTVLILYEQAEFLLYRIERELRTILGTQDHDVVLHPILGNVLDETYQQALMVRFGVTHVYHAAAYKHVPLVEENPVSGVRNNTFGTLATARAAIAANVGTFMLVSTDKAVNPTNVMGASKRLAEMLVQGIVASGQAGETRMGMVRFGNVLDSSGSVVPLFRDQIRQGGPVTITHPEVVRYFMTIPEASQLVLQASAMCEGGDVFVLDMGEPVKILDLAARMIRLMGFEIRNDEHPDGDIDIEFTGLRPGEKLYEELLIDGGSQATEHPMILRAREGFPAWDLLQRHLDELWAICERSDVEGIRSRLAKLVEGYEGSRI